MKIDEILNDKILCALSFLLITFWAVGKAKIPVLQHLDQEAAAATILRIACGFLLFGASLDKLGDAAGFLDLIKQCYFFISPTLRPLTAVIIPWLEFFTGLCLISGFRWRAASLVFCVLMAFYSLAVFWNVLHHVDCNCGCFKINSTEVMGWWTVARDLMFLCMGWIVLVSPRTFLSLGGRQVQKNAS